ncbi:tetratricopeptide repeat protein [Necropsobacter massiliensis]|uniref:tetratricopeptide repeat protein n=1 Tax=Necropsobacter massiliensis TaxID=1400001 RepID=UPI0005961819|nr:c-type cytochrome biogenesis protein [Necropsobacter massiliensis]
MTVFFIGILIFIVLALLIFAPLRAEIHWHENYRRQQNITLYQRQAVGCADAELADELAQRLLADEKLLENQPHFNAFADGTKRAVGFPLKLLLLALVILLPLGGYFALDRFDAVLQGERALTAERQRLADADTVEKNDDYIGTIQNRLRRDPNDAQQWLELGRAYMLNNQFDNALIAYGNAEKLSGSKASILGLAATARYYQSGQRITAQVRRLLDGALQQDPQETASLSLLAGEAFLHADYAEALNLWQRLLDSGKPDVDRRAIIQSMQMAEMLQQGRQ